MILGALIIKVTLVVAMVTIPGYGLVEHCNLVCQTSEGIPRGMKTQEIDCTSLNLLDLVTDDLDLVVDPKQIQPLFRSSCRVSSEIRWMPGLRAAWTLHPNASHYEVQISDLPHRRLRSSSNKSVCLSFDTENWDLASCSYECHDITSRSLLVRLLANSTSGYLHSESMINFHDFLTETHHKGLSAYYRRPFIHKADRGGLPNPRYWTPVVNVHNDSCQEQVTVTFDLAPPEVEVKKYRIMLIKNGSRSYEDIVSIMQVIEDYSGRDVWSARCQHGQYRDRFQPNETVVTHVFSNVTPGTYYLRVESFSTGGGAHGCKNKVIDEDGKEMICFKEYDDCKSGGSPSCLDVDTGLFMIKDKPRCSYSPMTLWTENPIDFDLQEESSIKGELSTLILTISLTGLVVIIVVLVIVLIIVRKKQVMRAAHSRLTRKDTSSTEPVISDLEEGVLEKMKVLLVYSRDNGYHITVVSKFARLLRAIGYCEVILDMEDGEIGRSTAVNWATDKFNKADKVIFIKSEGTLRRMNLDSHESYAIESKHLGSIFPASVHILESCALKAGKGKYITVAYNYSNLNNLSDIKFQCIFGNNNQFQLLGELNNLLLAIRDIPQCSRSGFFRQFSINNSEDDSISDSKAYKDLQEAIDKAFNYHQNSPNWFHNMYGEAVPKSPNENTDLSNNGEGEAQPDLGHYLTPTPSMNCLQPPQDEEERPEEECPLVPPDEQLTSSQIHSTELLMNDRILMASTQIDTEDRIDSGFRSFDSRSMTGAMFSVTGEGSPLSRQSLDVDDRSDCYDLYAPESVSSSVIDIISLQEQSYPALRNDYQVKI